MSETTLAVPSITEEETPAPLTPQEIAQIQVQNAIATKVGADAIERASSLLFEVASATDSIIASRYRDEETYGIVVAFPTKDPQEVEFLVEALMSLLNKDEQPETPEEVAAA